VFEMADFLATNPPVLTHASHKSVSAQDFPGHASSAIHPWSKIYAWLLTLLMQCNILSGTNGPAKTSEIHVVGEVKKLTIEVTFMDNTTKTFNSKSVTFKIAVKIRKIVFTLLESTKNAKKFKVDEIRIHSCFNNKCKSHMSTSCSACYKFNIH